MLIKFFKLPYEKEVPNTFLSYLVKDFNEPYEHVIKSFNKEISLSKC